MYIIKVFFVSLFIISSYNAQSLRSLNNDGVDKYKKNNFTEAEVNFRKGIENKSDEFIPHFNLGDAYYKQGKYDDAIKSYQQSISKTEDKNLKAKAHYNIGNSLLKSDKLKESIEAYKNSLKMNPNDNDAKYNLSFALKKLQQEQNNQNQKNENKDQNKDNQKNENKDKDENNENNDNQNNQDQKNNEQSQPKDNEAKQDQTKQNQEKMSKEEAERVLNALKDNEKDMQKKIRKKTGVRVKTEKDW